MTLPLRVLIIVGNGVFRVLIFLSPSFLWPACHRSLQWMVLKVQPAIYKQWWTYMIAYDYVPVPVPHFTTDDLLARVFSSVVLGTIASQNIFSMCQCCQVFQVLAGSAMCSGARIINATHYCIENLYFVVGLQNEWIIAPVDLTDSACETQSLLS